MVTRIGGYRRKTRYKFKKKRKFKGKLSLKRFLQAFKNGNKVVLNFDSAYQGGMYHHRFHGKTGTIDGKIGRCYNVKIRDGKKEKTLIVHPVHLRKVD
ncbi:50S ribosomal protein L21e [Candidatus Woesearchaeota archaeon]|nr:50S ribosomal protein L21e [Candidatus Woesearchaeota archaeon]